MTIRNPVEWSAAHISDAAHSVRDMTHALHRAEDDFDDRPITLRDVGVSDLFDALGEGFDDFVNLRTDVLAIGLIYPLAGLVLFNVAFNASLLPILFPLIAGFALVGPFAALGLYEASRRRETGEEVRWSNVIDAFSSPSAGAIWTLGLILTGLFMLWIATAWLIYSMTMGPTPPESMSSFASEVLGTKEGHAMIVVGCAVGAIFAVVALAISAISFPLLLDRRVRLGRAIETSVQAVRQNPVVMLTWGLIVACALVLGSLPVLLGLIVVMPVLGHATWKLYRKIVV